MFNSARTTPDLKADWSRQWHEVFSVNLDGTDLRQHTRCRAVCTYPSISPDGTRLAYRKVVDAPGFNWNLASSSRNSEVFVADLDGANEHNLSNSAAFDGWPAWTPDGRGLVFASNRAGPANVGHLYAVAVDGSGLRQLSDGPRGHVQPAFSRDGSRLHAYEYVEIDGYETGDVVWFPVER